MLCGFLPWGFGMKRVKRSKAETLSIIVNVMKAATSLMTKKDMMDAGGITDSQFRFCVPHALSAGLIVKVGVGPLTRYRMSDECAAISDDDERVTAVNKVYAMDVVIALRDCRSGLPTSQIREKAGMTMHTVKAGISYGLEYGLIVRVGFGIHTAYCLPEYVTSSDMLDHAGRKPSADELAVARTAAENHKLVAKQINQLLRENLTPMTRETIQEALHITDYAFFSSKEFWEGIKQTKTYRGPLVYSLHTNVRPVYYERDYRAVIHHLGDRQNAMNKARWFRYEGNAATGGTVSHRRGLVGESAPVFTVL